jgi:hypothetical protein
MLQWRLNATGQKLLKFTQQSPRRTGAMTVIDFHRVRWVERSALILFLFQALSIFHGNTDFGAGSEAVNKFRKDQLTLRTSTTLHGWAGQEIQEPHAWLLPKLRLACQGRDKFDRLVGHLLHA